jgi:uncharacterized protein (DUF736 family)
MAGYEHKEDTHPDYKGSCLLNGVKMEIAAWIKESSTGSKFMSLRFEEPRERSAAPKKSEGVTDEDIPF